jgi:uncharacterized repeat protein (TIGR01451 family)
MLLGSSGAWALGTDAGTDIDNDATLSFSAGGVGQPDVTSNTDTFKVDKKIDMVLVTTDTDQTDVTPGQTERITSYTFKNEGNSAQNFKFAVANLASGSATANQADYNTEADNEDVSNMVIEYRTSSGSSWQTMPANGISVAEDATIEVRVKADIPTAANGGADGDVMNIELIATAVDSSGNDVHETTTSDNPTDVDIVFADGMTVQNGATSGLGDSYPATDNHKGDADHDGKEVARSGYKIKTPVLDATKLSCVLSDPVNNTSNPKRIPGAKIIYVFDINNTGTADATDINLTDTLQADLIGSTVSNIWIETNTTRTTTPPCKCSDGSDMHSAGGAGGSDTDTNAQGIKIEGISVGSIKHTCVSFEVEIR